jgi:hypothetical protein
LTISPGNVIVCDEDLRKNKPRYVELTQMPRSTYPA